MTPIETVHRIDNAFDVTECHLSTLQDGIVVDAQFYIDSQAMLAALQR